MLRKVALHQIFMKYPLLRNLCPYYWGYNASEPGKPRQSNHLIGTTAARKSVGLGLEGEAHAQNVAHGLVERWV